MAQTKIFFLNRKGYQTHMLYQKNFIYQMSLKPNQQKSNPINFHFLQMVQHFLHIHPMSLKPPLTLHFTGYPSVNYILIPHNIVSCDCIHLSLVRQGAERQETSSAEHIHDVVIYVFFSMSCFHMVGKGLGLGICDLIQIAYCYINS